MIADFYRGDTKKYKLVIRDKDTQTPISVDGGTLTYTLKKKITVKDEDAALQVIVEGVEEDPLNPIGIIRMVVPHEKTASVDPGEYFYDFQFVSSTDEVTTIMSGKVTVLADTTTTV